MTGTVPESFHGTAIRKSARGTPGQGSLRIALAKAAAMGRSGDSTLAHIGPDEMALLQRAGGAGTINPKTGLLEFYTDAFGGGFGGGGAASQGSMGGPGGQGGGGISAGPGAGAGASGEYNSAAALARDNPITSASLSNQAAYADRGFLERAASFLTGFGRMDPTAMDLDALKTGIAPSSTPHMGFDALGGLFGVGGMFGVPGLGMIPAGLKEAGVIPRDFGTIDLTNLFGGGAPGVPGANVAQAFAGGIGASAPVTGQLSERSGGGAGSTWINGPPVRSTGGTAAYIKKLYGMGATA